MKIAGFKTCPITFGCNVPLVTATQRFEKATGILVIATSENGARGFGYADVFPRTGETQVSVREAIEGILASQIIGHKDAAALHLAGTTDSVSEFCELGEFEMLEEDLFEGLTIRSGFLNIPEMDGVGVTVRKDAPQSLLSSAAISLGDLLEN